MYRIWEAQNAGEEQTYLLACSVVREKSLREENRINLVRLVHETDDRNEARAKADCEL